MSLTSIVTASDHRHSHSPASNLMYTAFHCRWSSVSGGCLWSSLPHDLTLAAMLAVFQKWLQT